MSRDVIGFRVSPVDVAYAVWLCVTSFWRGRNTEYVLWYIFGPVEKPLTSLSLSWPLLFTRRNYK